MTTSLIDLADIARTDFAFAGWGESLTIAGTLIGNVSSAPEFGDANLTVTGVLVGAVTLAGYAGERPDAEQTGHDVTIAAGARVTLTAAPGGLLVDAPALGGFHMGGSGGHFTNAGMILDTPAAGLFFASDTVFLNSGHIIGTLNFVATEDMLEQAAGRAKVGMSFVNDGLIEGDIAGDMSAMDPAAREVQDSVANSGRVLGSVWLGSGADTLVNSGRIAGDVWLDARADGVAAVGGGNVFDGRGGTVSGTVYGGLEGDTYWVTDSGLRLCETASGRGQDVVNADASFVLAANFEVLNLLGSANHAGTGTVQANVLNGNAGDNVLRGLGGADQLNGGDGRDTADYAGSTAGVQVGLVTGLGAFGDARGDVLTGIENLSGSGMADSLTGDEGGNVLSGQEGSDILIGAGGSDVIEGGGGDDWLQGGAGADVMTGGEGRDLSDYDASGFGVKVSLEAGTGKGGDAEGDRFFGLEDLGGTAFADVLTGDGAANRLFGRDGSDRLLGGDGDDSLAGGAGKDALTGGRGADVFVFAEMSGDVTQRDRIADFSVAQGDRIDLSAFMAGAVLADVGRFSGLGRAEIVIREFGKHDTMVLADADGDGTAEFSVVLTDEHVLRLSDFVL